MASLHLAFTTVHNMAVRKPCQDSRNSLTVTQEQIDRQHTLQPTAKVQEAT
jgi:hypothetical protein